MADRKLLKRANHSEIPSDDPFAELTRIMGFDPREPVSRPLTKIVEAASIAPGDEDDLSIDLEKELMGEFAPADSEADAAPAQASPAFAAALRHLSLMPASKEPPVEDIDLIDAGRSRPPAAAFSETALSDELDAAFAAGPDLHEAPVERNGAAFDGDGITGRHEVSSTMDWEDEPEAAAPQPDASAEGDDDEAFAGEIHSALADEAESIEAESGSEEAEETYDAPLIRLAGARDPDFARAEGYEAEVDMDFAAEYADEPEAADVTADTTAADDDLEAELSALLGKGHLVAGDPHVGAGWTDASPSDEASLDADEMAANEMAADEMVADEPYTSETMEEDDIATTASVDDPIDEQAVTAASVAASPAAP